jgi:hypothetical protein
MPDNRMLLVAVAPAWLLKRTTDDHEAEIREKGELFMTDVMDDTEIELTDADVKIRVIVSRKRKDKADG